MLLTTGGKSSAASPVYVLYYLRGKSATGGEELCIEGLSVGYGARSFADGLDAVYYVAQENYPIEFAEMEFGIEIESFSFHKDSGGPGQYRGGCGIVRDVRVLLDEMSLGIRIDNCKYPAFGVNGGLSGGEGKVSPESALEDYGVVLTKDQRQINETETKKARKTVFKSKKMFHRREFYDAAEDRKDKYKT